MNVIDNLLTVARAYGDAVKLSESRVSAVFLSGGHRLKRIRGGGDIGARSALRAMQKFSAHWPPDTPWPAGVPRPAPAPAGSGSPSGAGDAPAPPAPGGPGFDHTSDAEAAA